MQQKIKIDNYCHNIGYEPYTLKWLQILCSSLQNVKTFTNYFYSGNKDREMFDVFKYRLHLLKTRQYSFKEFEGDVINDLQSALQKLCLCPVSSNDTETFKENIINDKFTLYEFYQLQNEKPKFNFPKLLNWLLA
jgi:hypothetical protein